MWEVKFYGYKQESGGPSVDILSNSEKYKNDSYDNIAVIRSFEIDDFKKDNYGAEISGYLTPKQEADYIFYLSSNDHSELWLSSNEDTNKLERIAKRDGVTRFRDFDAGGSESTGRSVAIRLEAGKRYAIKALLREDTGLDHLSVSWGFAGEAAPSEGAEPIALEYLSYDLGENNISGLQQSQGEGLIVKYYETVGEAYETGRTIVNRVPGRGLDQDGNKLAWKGNHLSVAHNNAINSGINPIKNPDDRTNNSGWGHRGGHVWDELRDWGNYDFRPKEGSALIDAGLAIEGFTIPFDGVTDGIIGPAPDIGAYEYGDSQYWIPGHQEEKASFPIGARDQTLIAKPDLDLIWQEGLDAESNLIYFGTNPDQLEFKIEQTGNIYDPTPEENEILSSGLTYYWRIDTKKSDDSIVKGDTWQFTVDSRPQQIEIESVYVDYQNGNHKYLVPKIYGGKAELSLPTYGYYISKYEITNSQYAAFLNEVAQYVNVGNVWDIRMQIDRESDPSGSGGYIYAPISGKESHPVTYVSWSSATLFTNWMSGEAGAIYGGNLNGYKDYTQRKDNQRAWGAGAISLPTQTEWIKSAYYNQATNTVYKYATGRTGSSNSITTNDANYGSTVDDTMAVGSYATPSFFGTYDQAGNVREMLDNKVLQVGGSFTSDTNGVSHRYVVDDQQNNVKQASKGFRIVSLAAIQKDKDNNGTDEFYITNFKNGDNRAPILENPRPASDNQSTDLGDEKAEDNTWSIQPGEIGKAYNFNIADSAFDPEGGLITFSQLIGPEWLTLNAEGELSGIPTKEKHLGTFNIQYKATDETGLFSITTEPIDILISQQLNATEEDDNLQTKFGTTWVFGLAGDDIITGSNQDEYFAGGAGNDNLNGGDGIDRAQYSGNKSDYSLRILDSGDVEITDLRETSPDGVDRLRDIEHLDFANGTRTVSDAISLTSPLSYEFISSFGMEDDDLFHDSGYLWRDTNNARPSYTSNQIILPWISNAVNTEDNKSYVRVTDFQGELLWEKLLGSYQTLATATDQNGDIYVAWSSLKPSKASMIGKFNFNGDLIWEVPLEHAEHTIFDMVVIGDNIYTAGGSSIYRKGVIYSLNTNDGFINWKSTQGSPIIDFLDIETDGTSIYLSGTSRGKAGHGMGVAQNTHAFKYDLDGNQLWNSNSKHYGQLSEEYGSTIFEDQLISAGKTQKKRNSPTGNFLVSRDLETGEVLWSKQFRDWGTRLVDIVTYKGTAYTVSIEDKAAVIHEIEKDGNIGRQLWIDLPEATTKGYSFINTNDELYLVGSTNGDTGVADNQGGNDIFLAKITTGLEDAEVPFSGIKIIATAPRDSQENLETSEDGSSTSFKVRLNQIPLSDEDVVVSLTGLDPTEGNLSTNKLTFNRSNWDIPQDIVITGVADNTYDIDTKYSIRATASNSGGYKGTEFETILVKNQNIDIDTSEPVLEIPKPEAEPVPTAQDPILEVTEPYQTITPSIDEINFYPGKDFDFDLLYTTSDNQTKFTGLGLKVHYDSSIFTPSGENNGVSAIVDTLNNPTIVDDTDNLDNDTFTDKYIAITWADLETEQNSSEIELPINLAKLNFSSSKEGIDSLTGESKESKINFTSSEPATGYDFLSHSVVLNPQTFNLDVDGDGSVNALGDGLMVIRKLFGPAFEGEDLTSKAISSDATRTTDEIHEYIAAMTTLDTIA